MEYREFTGKTVEDAVVEAAVQLGTTSDRMEYEILEKGSNGFLGIGSRPGKNPRTQDTGNRRACRTVPGRCF